MEPTVGTLVYVHDLAPGAYREVMIMDSIRNFGANNPDSSTTSGLRTGKLNLG